MPKQDLITLHFSTVLMDMAECTDISQITLAHLLKEAGTARQTFYNRFADLDDLICYTASYPCLAGDFPICDIKNTRRMYETALAHPAFYAQAVKRPGPHGYAAALESWAICTLEDFFIDTSRELLSAREIVYRKSAVRMFAMGGVGCYIDWIKTGMETPVEIEVGVIDDAVPPFIRKRRLKTPCSIDSYPR